MIGVNPFPKGNRQIDDLGSRRPCPGTTTWRPTGGSWRCSASTSARAGGPKRARRLLGCVNGARNFRNFGKVKFPRLAGWVIIEQGLQGEVEPHRLPGVTQFPDAYKLHAVVRILVAQPGSAVSAVNFPQNWKASTFQLVRLVGTGLWSATLGISVLWTRHSDTGLCPLFSNFRFRGGETGSLIAREQFEECQWSRRQRRRGGATVSGNSFVQGLLWRSRCGIA